MSFIFLIFLISPIVTCLEIGKRLDEPCDCVQPYFCENGRIKTDGAGIITWRLAERSCKKDEVCCLLPEGYVPDSSEPTSLPKNVKDSNQDENYPEVDSTDDFDNFDGGQPQETEEEEEEGNGDAEQPTGPLEPVPPPEVPATHSHEDEEEEEVEDGGKSLFVCGHRQQIVTLKVSGDSEDTATGPGDFPWTLLLKYKLEDFDGNGKITENILCGASLVLPSVAITAAHCVERKLTENLVVRAGEWDLADEDEPTFHQDRKVQKVIIHPKYEQIPIKYDIAILVLDKPFEKSSTVNNVCMPGKDVKFDINQCYATGWGAKNDQFPPIGDQTLRKARLRLLDREECQSKLKKTKLGPRFSLHKSFNCAGGDDETDTCKGDGGGPLACMNKDPPYNFFLAGITSWGIGCGRKGIPGVYTDVLFMSDWVKEEIIPLIESGVVTN